MVWAWMIAGTVSAVFFILSYLVWKKKKLNLMAGYDEKRVRDKNRLARYSGIFLMVTGGLILVSPLFLKQLPFLIGAFIFYTLAFAVWMQMMMR